MKKSALFIAAISVVVISMITTSNSVNAMASVKYDYTKTTITLTETVEFSAEASSMSNMTWYCDDVAVKSEWATSSNYSFIPKALGTYFIKLSVDGFTNPPPMGPTKVTVIAEPAPAPPQTMPILPHATYHSGDSYTTVYVRNITAPPSGTKPPIVTILSPANYSAATTNNVTLAFDLTATASSGFHPDSFIAHYTTSWEPDHNISIASESSNASITLTGIPDGQQWVRVYATALSSENETGRENVTKPNTPDSLIIGKFLYIYSDAIGISDSSSVNFTIDTSSPVIPPGDGLGMDSAGTILLALGATALIVILVLAYLKRKNGKQGYESNSLSILDVTSGRLNWSRNFD